MAFATSVAMLLMIVVAASSSKLTRKRLSHGDSLPGCSRNHPELTAPWKAIPWLSISGPLFFSESNGLDVGYWYLPHDSHPGPIRHLVMGCVTVNMSLQTFSPQVPETNIFKGNRFVMGLFMAPCTGEPNQDFIMPDNEWMQGCGGRIKWAVNDEFVLSSLNHAAVLTKSTLTATDERWYVNNWERSWVLTFPAQFTLMYACCGTTLVLLLFQAFRLLRTSFFVFKLLVGVCLTHRLDIRPAAVSTLRCFASKARHLIRSGLSEYKDLESLSVYNSRRVARVLQAMRLMQPVFSLVLLANLESWSNALIWSFFLPPEERNPGHPAGALASTGLLPTVVLFVWATFFSACPKLLNARTLDCSSVALSATWAVQFGLVSQNYRNRHNDQKAWMNIMQVLTATVLGNAPLATVLQVMLAAVHIRSNVRLDADGGMLVANHEFGHQIALLVMLTAVIWIMDLETWTEAKAIVRAQQADSSRSMVSRLLDSMCDAVVPIDQSLCIGAAGSQQLASLLMHQGSRIAAPLKGMPMKNLVKSEDHQLLDDFLARELAAARASFGAQAPIASSLQIHLRDAFNIFVPVELICSCSLGTEGDGFGPLQYLLGVKELDSDRFTWRQPCEQDREPMDTGSRRSTPPERHGRSPLRLEQISETEISNSDGSSSESAVPHMDDLTVWVDFDSEQLNCVHWTPGAGRLLQLLPANARFLERVQEKPDMLQWLRAGVPESSWPSKKITLQLPRQGGGGRQRPTKERFFVTCATAAELPEIHLPSEKTIARLDLHKHRKQIRYIPPHMCNHELPHALVWMDPATRAILKARNAPRFVFQEGSCVLVSQGANQESDAGPTFIGHIQMEIMNSMLTEEKEPVFLGPWIFESTGYQLRAETTLLDWGEDWQTTEREWCLLCLDHFRSMTNHGSEKSV